MRFLDTNILLYAVSSAPRDINKRRIAQNILHEGDLVLSAQVLQEFYAQATSEKVQFRMSQAEAQKFVYEMAQFHIVPITSEIVLAAIAISSRFQLRYWDGAILAASRSIGCDTVYSEDFSHTQDYGGVRVINPFI